MTRILSKKPLSSQRTEMNGQAPRNAGSLQQGAVKVGLFLYVNLYVNAKQEIRTPCGFRITDQYASWTTGVEESCDLAISGRLPSFS